MPVTLRAIPVVAELPAGSPMLETSKGRCQTKRDPPLPPSYKNHCLVVKRDLQRLGETTLTENNLLEGLGGSPIMKLGCCGPITCTP